ncbi:hypothetical protein [sulfur-oxidizing endosymbiont of Gigantopelta aegis]|uniref:hypothetical protein n=1 Tax=sulfur-oxidizing endosymbiont of Gigantopelta aegis TaxID=2794934 RepID=UPI0018DB3EB6|nr:hypothetical protein [sulfur-oxidizing endosymbiont of Gigantopelta aegis]
MPIKPQRSIRFIIPGLIDPVSCLDQLPISDLPALPVFSKMLSRGQMQIPDALNNDPNNLYQCLFTNISNNIDNSASSSSSPFFRRGTEGLASLSYYFDIKSLTDAERKLCNVSLESLANDAQQGKWIMRADPCFLAADRDQLVLAQCGSFELRLSDAQALADEINQFFQGYSEENFWTLKVTSPERWYIISERPLTIQSIPPENVLGQAIRDYLFSHKKFIEQGTSNKKDASHCLTLFNEFQMILHQSEINKKRLADKKIPINSLWFWGGGELNDYTQDSDSDVSRGTQTEDTIVYSQHALVKSWAEINNQKHLDLADDFLLNAYQPHIEQLQTIYVIDDFMRAIRNKDIFTWVGLLEQFEKNYLEPLSKELKSGNISQIEIISPTGKQLVINKRSLNRWWKKIYPYHVLF